MAEIAKTLQAVRPDPMLVVDQTEMTRRGKRERPTPHRKCIFCGRGGLSGEHLWSDWASPLLPDAVRSNITRYTADPSGERRATLDYSRDRQGGVKKHKVRAVCSNCNRGWMNVIEQGVRAVLTAMIEGRPLTLLPDGIKSVREWVTLKIMVAEHDQAGVWAITPADRQAFFDDRTIPEGLSAMLYQCGEGTWRSYYRRNAITLLSNPPPPADFDLRAKNVATATFGIGDLLISTLYRRPEVSLGLIENAFSIPLIPSDARHLSWPPANRLTAEAAAQIDTEFDRLLAGPTVRKFSDWTG